MDKDKDKEQFWDDLKAPFAPENCGCVSCARPSAGMMMSPNFLYACEICGNKRCPHHTHHARACTNSNEPGQKGSIYK